MTNPTSQVIAATARETIHKLPGESRLLSMDFSPRLSTGDTLSSDESVTAERQDGSSVDLTLGSAAISGNLVSVQVSGGTTGKRYRLLFTATTTLGDVLQQYGILVVD